MYKTSSKNNHIYSHENRLLGKFYGSRSSPTVVVFSGIHGNEKAGVLATERVIRKIQESHMLFNGNLYFILGNINALNLNQRFENVDLNRIWRNENIESLKNNGGVKTAEEREQEDIFHLIKEILTHEQGPFYFLDLHTTSASSVPFITISDSLNNRKFSSNFPVPVVLGIEEYLDGPLLTFINEFGHVALGFEGGAHEDEISIDTCEAFIWKALVHSKCVDKDQVKNFQHYRSVLADLCCRYEFFAINYRYELNAEEDFQMKEGFDNFESIEKNQFLATSDGQEIRAVNGGRIFMPLYQKQGEDGFFILHRISKFWLKASIVARKLKINHFLRLIPGVKMDKSNSYTLIVNPRIARFMAKEIFHLFGYRQQIFKDDQLHFIKRDRKVRQWR